MNGTFPHEEVVAPSAVSMDPDKVERARRLFESQQRSGAFPGGQLVVRRGGKLVLDFAVGLARGHRPGEPARVEVTPETRFAIFSASKPVVAIAIAMLEERGLLDVQAPVARYWPEFGRNGKAELTVLDVLTHRAGVLSRDLMRHPDRWADWDRVCAEIAEVVPRYRRGTLAYMPYEFGWILAEVARRVLGRPLNEFIEEQIARPAELPGLRFGVTEAEIPSVAWNYWVGKKAKIAGVELSRGFERANNRAEVLCSFVPAAGIVCDAATLAGFYEVLARGGVARSGRRILKEETVRLYTTRNAAGLDRSNNVPLSVGRGFMLGTWLPSIFGWWDSRSCYGHSGVFCTLGFADHRTGVAAAIVTNGNAGPLDMLRRTAPLCQALRDACRPLVAGRRDSGASMPSQRPSEAARL